MSNNISAKRKNPDYLQVFTKPNRDPTSVEAEHVEINRGQIQDLQDSTRDPATYRLYQHEVLSPPVCNQVDGQDCKRRRVSDSTPSESVTCNDVRDIENIQATPTPNCIGSDLLNEKKLKTPQSALIVEKYLRLGEELRDCKSQLKQIMDQQTVASRAAEDISEEFKCGICQETFIDPVTIQPCGHSYCGACLSNYLRSFKINEKLVWTHPGHHSNLLEAHCRQERRKQRYQPGCIVHPTKLELPKAIDSRHEEETDEWEEGMDDNDSEGTYDNEDDEDSEDDEGSDPYRSGFTSTSSRFMQPQRSIVTSGTLLSFGTSLASTSASTASSTAAPADTGPTSTSHDIKLGEGRLSSNGLSCVFCKHTPITGVAPALALGAATELLVKSYPHLAREQEAIRDHRAIYKRGDVLSFPIPVTSLPSYTSVARPSSSFAARERSGLTNNVAMYWPRCAHCLPSSAGDRFVCPSPVPDPQDRLSRIPRTFPCPGHLICGPCHRVIPEQLSVKCDGCGYGACDQCEVQVLRRLNRLRPRGETVVGTAAFNDTGPRHVKLLLELFRENATEAAIFSAFIELSQKVTSRDPSVRSLPPFDHFKFSEIFEELDDWISNSEQGRSSGGLKGVLDRNGSNGTILTSGGSGKFCNGCGHRILKAGLYEWWMRRVSRGGLPKHLAEYMPQKRCRWGYSCFYQANQAHAREYSHLCARAGDKEMPELAVDQPIPTTTGTPNNRVSYLAEVARLQTVTSCLPSTGPTV